MAVVATVCVSAALATALAASLGPRLKHRAGGELTDVSGGVASGSFDLRAWVRDGGSEKPKVVIRAEGLDGTLDDDGDRPDYGGFVIDAQGGEVFVGRVPVNHKGSGKLKLKNARGFFEGVGLPLRSFGGGTVEVRRGAVTILRGAVPEFTLDGAGATSSRSETYGLFVALAAPNHRPGRYQLRTDEFETGEIRNRIVVQASGVLTGTSPPTYSVRLINEAGSRIVTLGNMDNHPEIGASFVMDSRNTTIPGGIVRWSEFNGGLIEVRRGSTIMLRGDITPIHEADRPVEQTGNARWKETVELLPTTGDARGLLLASVRTGPRRRTQEIRLRIEDVDPAAGPFTVTVVVGGATITHLATFDVRGAAATGGFRLSTRRGDPLPDRFVFDAAGGPVEVTDSADNVVLTATFPTFE